MTRNTDMYDYSKKDVVQALRAAGVKPGDVVFTHVGMGFLGYPKEGRTQDIAAQVIADSFFEVLGPKGTLLVPTYTYSFTKGEDFDPKKTPSTIGFFTEKFRKMRGVQRSVEPIFSVAGKGPRVKELFSNLPPVSFGPDCIYDRLLKINASICNVGVGFRFATFIHFVERSVGVPYRSSKIFKGNLIDGKKKIPSHIESHVRSEANDTDTFADLTRLEDDLREANVLHEVPLGKSTVTRIQCRDLFEYGSEAIKKDAWYLTRGYGAKKSRIVKK